LLASVTARSNSLIALYVGVFGQLDKHTHWERHGVGG
jgi:hypothetical protein